MELKITKEDLNIYMVYIQKLFNKHCFKQTIEENKIFYDMAEDFKYIQFYGLETKKYLYGYFKIIDERGFYCINAERHWNDSYGDNIYYYELCRFDDIVKCSDEEDFLFYSMPDKIKINEHIKKKYYINY